MTSESLMTRAEIQERAARIAAESGADVRFDEPMARHLSMRVGGAAAAFVMPKDAQSLALVVRRLDAEAVPRFLLGGGSNLLVADAPLDAVVVQVSAAAGAPTWTGETVRASAGMPLALLVSEAARRGLGGLEWAAGLPGTLGGAVFGNAGAFGSDIGASVTEVVLLGADGALRTHVPAPGDFRYRRSFVRPGEVVIEAALRLRASEPQAVRDETNRVNRQRAGSQPKGGHSAGCMFKNPDGASAGRLVDECGLKGLRVGGASVATAHGNFVLNSGTATAADIASLVRRVRDEVRRQRGVELEIEVQAWPSRRLLDAPDAGGEGA
jgi:UDP-N-acetylmuramate dehydrogenase